MPSPNVFVSLHGMAHNLKKTQPNEYFTVVPRGLRVYMFAPTNYCVYSNESSEEMMMHMLKSPSWRCSPECGKGGIFEHTQLYSPGSTITNLMLDGDEDPHYGAHLMTTPSQKLPITFDTRKKPTTYDVERLLQELAPKNKKETRDVYLCICSPHTISPHACSVLKWKGRVQPIRKATKKYESFHLTPELVQKARTIQTRRFVLEQAGRDRFRREIPVVEHRFTRSMSFPVKHRNGSVDHELPKLGKGLCEEAAREEDRGLYFKVDVQDTKTELIYQNLLKKLIDSSYNKGPHT